MVGEIPGGRTFILQDEKCTHLRLIYKCYSPHSLIKTQICMMHIKFVKSGENSISTIIINNPQKDFLQINKGMVCCVVPNKTFTC